MKLTYDPTQNLAYITLRDAPAQVETVRVGEELNIDMAPDGSVYGIELLNANVQLTGAPILLVNEASGQTAQIRMPA